MNFYKEITGSCAMIVVRDRKTTQQPPIRKQKQNNNLAFICEVQMCICPKFDSLYNLDSKKLGSCIKHFFFKKKKRTTTSWFCVSVHQ